MGIDIVNFYSSYGSYHSNIVNKAIHLVCIPLILLSAVQITNHYSFTIDTGCCQLNFGLIMLFVLALVYMTVDLVSGILASSFYIAVTLFLNQRFANSDEAQWSNHLFLATTFQVACWILQFIGHGVFEKRAPALLDNILQIFVAPDFVFLEVLFFLGYKPQIHKACQTQIENSIKQFRNSKKEI
ncbi:unnamed protein product (macronuclear) [Paramecium tetraurelia]|uniref:Endoplasmic reticulum membrane protein n=1 Tax=Paramecium tetraurelia TaxID=5888 RepID=A0DE18_PARTE|nr:uncharacterized protein GSPATT00016127001 [Paramecium tetraurelia]CAK81285.1 unnamed protein product [Paramecium tetraurelia]|eukprot:XP_001448682.1 hypothetical protein (macronuclear) [Paramecium tetraurelia strain d4-2]